MAGVLELTPGINVGTLLGTLLANTLSSTVLKNFFGFFELVIGLANGPGTAPQCLTYVTGANGHVTGGKCGWCVLCPGGHRWRESDGALSGLV